MGVIRTIFLIFSHGKGGGIMAETQMSVKLIAHTQLSKEFLDVLWKSAGYSEGMPDSWDDYQVYDGATDGQAVALTAIRTCYSPNKPSEIVALEGEKYFGNKASDGEGGTEADRLFRHITRSGHTSTLEHISFTFAIEGVSRALLAQLTRHRAGYSYSVQSQRYVKFGTNDRGELFHIVPHTIKNASKKVVIDGVEKQALEIYTDFMERTQIVYDALRECGVPAEDARYVFPNAVATNLTLTANLTALLSFFGKRQKGRGAQGEIAELAERLRKEVVEVEPWTSAYFDAV